MRTTQRPLMDSENNSAEFKPRINDAIMMCLLSEDIVEGDDATV